MKVYVPVLRCNGTFVFTVPDGLTKDQAVQWIKDNKPSPETKVEQLQPNFDAARLTEEIHRNYEKGGE